MGRATMKISFLAGQTFVDAVKESSRIARLLGLSYVEFDFNGISCSISQTPDIKKLKEQFHKVISEEGGGTFIVG